jgi:hypothetical protein
MDSLGSGAEGGAGILGESHATELGHLCAEAPSKFFQYARVLTYYLRTHGR